MFKISIGWKYKKPHERKRAVRKRLLAIPLACILAMVTLASAGAAPARSSFTVGCGDVTGLVQAIADANGMGGSNDISLAPDCTYDLKSVYFTDPNFGPDGLPIITSKLTLHGNNSTISRNSAAPSFRIFHVGYGYPANGAIMLALDNITIRGGDLGSLTQTGGGIYNSGGYVILTNSTISGNRAYDGGGIENAYGGVLEITASTISGNTATMGGGALSSDDISNQTHVKIADSTISGNHGSNGAGLRNMGIGTLEVARSTIAQNISDWGGGLYIGGQVTLSDVTLFGNSASQVGGGIYVPGANLQVINSTVLGNTATNGQALYFDSQYAGSVTIKNSLFADSGCYGTGAASDGGHNLDSAASCGFSSANGSLSNTNPKVATALASNGGSTQTIALLSGSPAIDSGDDATCANPPIGGVDQRGVTRPQGGHCDIGAFEGSIDPDSTPPTITITSPTHSTYLIGQVETASYTCQDEAGGSGLASCAGTVANAANIDTTWPGAHTFQVTATDKAGNTSTRSVNYTVKYSFGGFLAPVSNPPTLNTGKAGKTYPIKWQLTDASGNIISDLGAVTGVTYKATSCSAFTGDSTAALETEVSGNSSLRYDSTSYQFVYNWATPGAGCYTLFLTLKDGAQYPAYLQLQ